MYKSKETAKPLYREYEQLMRELSETLNTPASKKDLAGAVFHLATVTKETDGPETAKPLYREYEQLIRELSETLTTCIFSSIAIT